MSFIVTTFIILHLKEVLINYNTHDADNDCRNADKACKNEDCHVFGIAALYKTNEKSGNSGEEDYDVVHVFVCLLVFQSVTTLSSVVLR